MAGSNRTIVGLKLRHPSFVDFRRTRSNRTIVGLKLGHCEIGHWSLFAQQSHHCGIETATPVQRLQQGLLQQSHHCGIETWVAKVNRLVWYASSNRTIVGLKLHLRFVVCQDKVAQQSHHCGIETETYEYHREVYGVAAIAPLWD